MTATAAVSLHRVNKALVPLALLWGPSDAKDAKSKLQIASTAYMFGTSFGTSGAENASAFAISQVLGWFWMVSKYQTELWGVLQPRGAFSQRFHCEATRNSL